LEIYTITKDFPAEEKFGLTSQLRRASCSTGSNLTEGCGRATNKELARFIAIAQGSAFEVRY
jgi:four helix bundle protein